MIFSQSELSQMWPMGLMLAHAKKKPNEVVLKKFKPLDDLTIY